MKVYVLGHDPGSYIWDECWMRGVFASKEDAERAIATALNPGNVIDHSDQCCEVTEWEVTLPQRVLA